MIKLCLFLVFLSLFPDIWSVSAIESAYREDSAAKFFCAMSAGDSVLQRRSSRPPNPPIGGGGPGQLWGPS